jgi:hypothetical protein
MFIYFKLVGFLCAQPLIGFPVYHSAPGAPITGSGYVGITPRSRGQTNTQLTTYCTYSPQAQPHFWDGQQSDSVVQNIYNAETVFRKGTIFFSQFSVVFR